MLGLMSTRILEPEVMDTEEEAEEYDAMDFSEPNTRFAEDALRLVASVERPRVLDLGTGTARIPLLMLERHPQLTVVAVDLSESMLRVAARHVASLGVGSRIELSKMDGKGVDLAPASFDLVMSNSVAHHIPDPADLFREVRRLVKPRGAILVRDLFRPLTVEAAREIVDRVAPNDSEKQRGLFFDSLRAALTVAEVRAIVSATGLAGVRVERVSDRHWTAERVFGTLAAVDAPKEGIDLSNQANAR